MAAAAPALGPALNADGHPDAGTAPGNDAATALGNSARTAVGRSAGWALGLVLPLGLALGWEAVNAGGLMTSRLLPPPSAVLAELGKLATTGELWTHVEATTLRVAAGFALGMVAGTAMGALTGFSTLARRLFEPSLDALRAIPSIAWVPLFILWFGIFETSKVILIAVGVFFPIHLALSAAIAGVDRKLVEVGRAFRLSPLALVGRVLLPATLPAWLTALRAGLALGWMFVVAAELMGASEGVGYLLIDGQQTGRPALILAALTVFALLGKASDLVLAAVAGRLTRWQDGFRR